MFDRQSKRLFEIEKEPGTNSYYPVFLKNGNLAYISEKKVGVRSKFKVVVVEPNYDFQSNVEVCTSCLDDYSQRKALAIIGGLVQSHCHPSGIQITESRAMVLALNLPSQKCRELVERNGNDLGQAKKRIVASGNSFTGFQDATQHPGFNDLTKARLIEACNWRASQPRSGLKEEASKINR
ncbi:MAG: hypothetical protein AB7G93_01100 [Bdellovibrionales bacterium]